MTDLKPCPFCGSTDRVVLRQDFPESWTVGCYNGQCVVRPITCYRGMEANAIAAWNTRAGESK